MRKLLILTIVSFLVGFVIFSSGEQARAGDGVNPVKLLSAGWLCVPADAGGVVCLSPGMTKRFVQGHHVLTVLVFDVLAEDALFFGSAILIREDKYHDQPCGPEGLDEWRTLDGYRVCHHF